MIPLHSTSLTFQYPNLKFYITILLTQYLTLKEIVSLCSNIFLLLYLEEQIYKNLNNINTDEYFSCLLRNVIFNISNNLNIILFIHKNDKNNFEKLTIQLIQIMICCC